MKNDRELFMDWFIHLLHQSETCLMRDVLRNQKENLWAEWQKVQPYETEEEECTHEEHESGVCMECGEEIEMSYEYEHDSGDMER